MLAGEFSRNVPSADKRIKIGFVSSLDALAVMQGDGTASSSSLNDGGDSSQKWSPVSCQAYSNIVHQLLNGTLQGGLVPFDLFAVNLLAQPQQYRRWAVLGVHVRCSWEFLAAHHAHRWLGKVSEGKRHASAMGEFRIAMAGCHPIVKRRIDRWMKKHHGDDVQLSYHVLPVKLMRRAIESGAMDAVALPAPWGHAAQFDGLGMVEPTLEQNGWDLGMLLVVDRDAVENLPLFFKQMKAFVSHAADHTKKMSDVEIARHVLRRDLFGNVSEEIMLQAASAAAASQPIVFDVPPEHLSSRLTLLTEFGILNTVASPAHEVAAAMLNGLK